MTTSHPSSAAVTRPVIDVSAYDLSPALKRRERRALASIRYEHRERSVTRRCLTDSIRRSCARLIKPIDDVLHLAEAGPAAMLSSITRALLLAVCDRGSPYWAWSSGEWLTTIKRAPAHQRRALRAVAYLIAGEHDIHARVSAFDRRRFAHAVLGREAVEASIEDVERGLTTWGFGARGTVVYMSFPRN